MGRVETIKENIGEVTRKTSLSKVDVQKINKVGSYAEMEKILQPDATLNLVDFGRGRQTNQPTYWIKDGELLWFDRIGGGFALSICDGCVYIPRGCTIEIPNTYKMWKTRKGAVGDIDNIAKLASGINKDVKNIFACIKEVVGEKTNIDLLPCIPQVTKKGGEVLNNKGNNSHNTSPGTTTITPADTTTNISAPTISNPNTQQPLMASATLGPEVYKQLVLIMPKDSKYFDMLKPIRAFDAEDEPRYVKQLLLNG